MPNILYNQRYFEPYSPGTPSSDKTSARDFVAGGGLFNYLTRNGAAEKENIQDIQAARLVENLAETSTERKQFESQFDYATSRPGSTGAFDINGDITPERAALIKNELQLTKSIIWTGVLSFDEEYGKRLCDNKAAAYELLKNTLRKLFAKSNLDYSNIQWYAALHRNTDNRHIHITFWEKEPTHLRKNSTEYQYTRLGNFKQECFDNFKFEVGKFLETEKLAAYKIRDNLAISIRHEINTSEKKDALLELLAEAKRSGRWTYNSQTKDCQTKILQFVMDIINSNVELKNQYDDFNRQVLTQQNEFFRICRENDLPLTPEIKDYADRYISDLHRRLGNDVLAALKSFDILYQKILKQYSSQKTRNENKRFLQDEDIKLLQKILEKKTMTNFKDLFEGNYYTVGTGNGAYYSSEDAALLGFAAILIFKTQDEQQFQRIVSASGVYSTDLEKAYTGQIDFATKKYNIDTKGKTYKQVLFETALEQYKARTILPTAKVPAALQDKDGELLDKIYSTKKYGDGVKIIFSSTWENTQHDTTGELNGYYYHCFHLVNIISKFTNDKNQIERLFQASPLYREDIWNSPFSRLNRHLPWIAPTSDDTFGAVLVDYCVEKNEYWRQVLQGKQGKEKKQGFSNHKILAAARQSENAIKHLVNGTFNIFSQRFNNSFNQFQNAIKEQKRRRKQAEGTIAPKDTPKNE